MLAPALPRGAHLAEPCPRRPPGLGAAGGSRTKVQAYRGGRGRRAALHGAL